MLSSVERRKAAGIAGIMDLQDQRKEIDRLILEEETELKKLAGPRWTIGDEIKFPYFRWFRNSTIVGFAWDSANSQWTYKVEYAESPKHPDLILTGWVLQSKSEQIVRELRPVADASPSRKKKPSNRPTMTRDEIAEDMEIFSSLDALLADVAKTGKVG